MIKNLLKTAYEQKKLVDINFYETEESIIGYITNIEDKYITIEEIDKFGNVDGTTIYKIDCIKNISMDNWYLSSLKIIINNNSQLNKNNRLTLYKNGQELISYFKYLKDKNKIVMLFFENDNYELGLVLNYDNEFILLKDIEQDGHELGITCYRLSDIIGLKYNGLGEQKTELLYNALKDIKM
ncbi:hypothetical protein FACS1894178_8930 [Bacteroidia bacterium]|nr:hypothetical protein FACS1894178_8930 [Bacteroidia bacterium]